jgi:hypothetical protein
MLRLGKALFPIITQGAIGRSWPVDRFFRIRDNIWQFILGGIFGMLCKNMIP